MRFSVRFLFATSLDSYRAPQRNHLTLAYCAMLGTAQSTPRYHIYDRTLPSSLLWSGVRPNLLESTASTPVSTSGRV
jgi:hypothetical protein